MEVHGSREVALDALKRVVEGCVAGMQDLPDLLEERAATTQTQIRARVVPMLGANAVAQRFAFEQAELLRAELPAGAQADVGVDYLQGVSEGLALLAQDAGDPLIPDQEDLARWTADPQMLRWLQSTSGGVPDDVLTWADGAGHGELTPADAGPERTAAVERALRAELHALPGGYRALAGAYATSRTRGGRVRGRMGTPRRAGPDAARAQGPVVPADSVRLPDGARGVRRAAPGLRVDGPDRPGRAARAAAPRPRRGGPAGRGVRLLILADEESWLPLPGADRLPSPDVVVTLGDLAPDMLDPLGRFAELPVLGVYGNHDDGRYLEAANTTNMHLARGDASAASRSPASRAACSTRAARRSSTPSGRPRGWPAGCRPPTS